MANKSSEVAKKNVAYARRTKKEDEEDDEVEEVEEVATTTNNDRRFGQPVEMTKYVWWIFDKRDLFSIKENNSLVTGQAFFILLHKKVYEARLAGQKIGFFQPRYYEFWRNQRGGPRKIHNEYYYFKDENNTQIIVPIFHENRYALLHVEYLRDQQHVTYIDPSCSIGMKDTEMLEMMCLTKASIRRLDHTKVNTTTDQPNNSAIFTLCNIYGLIDEGLAYFKKKRPFNPTEYRKFLFDEMCDHYETLQTALFEKTDFDSPQECQFYRKRRFDISGI